MFRFRFITVYAKILTMSRYNRRDFLQFLGAASMSSLLPLSFTSCEDQKLIKGPFPSFKDDLVLAHGLKYNILISWGDKISATDTFGFNNDYLEWVELSPTELILWVNHEYPNPLFISGVDRTKENIIKEQYSVGGSLVKIVKDKNQWRIDTTSSYNKRITGATPIAFANGKEVRGSKVAMGTLGNCAGGKTPWDTILTCEENYQDYYGERKMNQQKVSSTWGLQWDTFFNNPPEHYGWVVEIDPKSGMAKKHTNLGRFSHECATCTLSKSQKVVVYSGDDKNDEHLYKFVSESSTNLDKGTLYVANLEKQKWEPLNINNPKLKPHFENQMQINIYTREAAKLVGATALNRPEDIEIHPRTGDIYISLTNNKSKGDYHGSILRLSEKNDYDSLQFRSETFIFGGDESGLSCPDNLAFDKKGNLWVCTDISGGALNKKPYKEFGNNALFVIPIEGQKAGVPIQIASAPRDAELTGIKFSPDYQTLFLSVQHPGEMTKDISQPTSKWPFGQPKPSVVTIQGKLLDALMG